MHCTVKEPVFGPAGSADALTWTEKLPGTLAVEGGINHDTDELICTVTGPPLM